MGNQRHHHGGGPAQDLVSHDCPEQSVFILGGFQVVDEGRIVLLSTGEQRLLVSLALHDRPVRRIWVAGTLWPEKSEHHANASLRSSLWRLGRHSRPLIMTTRSHIWLAPHVVVDRREMELLAGRLLDAADELTDADLERLWLWQDLLPDWYEDWIDIERERLRQLRLYTLESVCERLIGTRRFRQATQTGLAAVAVEPLRDSAQRLLIRACLAEGNLWMATRSYRRYQELLNRELGIDPSAETQALLMDQSPSQPSITA